MPVSGETLSHYKILRPIGKGGMGEVYLSEDMVLDRQVALKFLPEEMQQDPIARKRFLREAQAAATLNHPFVCGIHEIGEAQSTTFIVMEYVAGETLKERIARGPISLLETLQLGLEIAEALEIAHEKRIVHRDLKPANIMLTSQGHAKVMDFGLAKQLFAAGNMESQEETFSATLTQKGAAVGTVPYMSPEQARGEEIDVRSDIFAFGVILYEMLTGSHPFRKGTAIETLSAILRDAPPPMPLKPVEAPAELQRALDKAMAKDRTERYQRIKDLASDLKELRDTIATGAMPVRARRPAKGLSWKVMLACLSLLLFAAAGLVFKERIFFRSASNHPASIEAISLAILPFRNASGDAALDWLGPSLAEMLRTDVGQSSYLRTVSSDRLHQILRDLRVSPDSNHDPETLRRLAEFTNADRLVMGQYLRVGDQIRIDATLQDLKRQQVVPLKAGAPNEKELLGAIDQLARSIQQNLTLSAKAVKELRAVAFTPSSKSVQALRYYSEGLELSRQGKHLEALKRFEASSKEDNLFAMAYSKLGQTYADLGYDKAAEQISRKAVDLTGKATAQEKYLILATHARIVNDHQKAIEAYENLAKVSPDDTDVQFNLAGLYQSTGSFDRARELYAKLLANDPKYVDAMVGMARVEVNSGKPLGGLDYLNRALSLAIQLENDDQKAAILLGLGVTYKLLNKPNDALRTYQEALEIKQRLGDKRGIGLTLDNMAQVQDLLGNSDAALKAYQEALKLRREIEDKRGIGGTLINLGNFYETRGQYDEALALTKESLQIQHEIGEPTSEADCLNNIGWIYLGKSEYDEAITYFERALQLREKLKAPGDIADTLYNLAETSARMGVYDKALANYIRALELWRGAGDKRGVAFASYGMGTLFGYQGRYGAAVNSLEEALKTFRELRDRSFWLAEVLSSYGNALSLVGRGKDAQKNLEEALELARALQNKSLIARVLNFQGDRLFYNGGFRSAKPLYEQALHIASRTTDRQLVLVSKFNLAKVAVKEGPSQAAITNLRGIAQQSGALRLKYLSTECAILLAEALLGRRDYSGIQQELEPALRSSEDLGARALLVRCHYLFATALHGTGKEPEALRHYAEVRRILAEIHQEARSDEVLKRSDLGPIYEESARSSWGPKA